MTEQIPARIGKYPVVRELGRGATSRVYLGRDPFANRDVAIKVVRAEAEVDTETRRRFDRVFLNEAALVGRLVHPHIMQIFDADATDEHSYIVMEYIEGQTLEHYCDIARLLPVERVVEIAFKCSLALDFAHRHGVIHRDIKPANILISAANDIKISDFGAAKLDSAEHTLLQGIGSPAYMSPEQVLEKELTQQTDIYSLGVVMFQMLTGRLPFVASNKASLLYQIVHIESVSPSVHRADLPRALDAVVMKAMAKGYVPITIKGSMTTMPADFLIDEQGIIRIAHYGKDEGDHLPFEEVRAFSLAGAATNVCADRTMSRPEARS